MEIEGIPSFWSLVEKACLDFLRLDLYPWNATCLEAWQFALKSYKSLKGRGKLLLLSFLLKWNQNNEDKINN